jgi:hypothetical protein
VQVGNINVVVFGEVEVLFGDDDSVSEHNPNLVLDINGGSKDQGAKLIVWDFKHSGNENQRFRINDQGFITSVHSGLVLDVEGGSKQGNHIIQWPAHGGENQRWRLHKDGTIRLEGHDLCIDIKGGSKDHGAELIAWPHNGGTNQKWRLFTKWH